MIDLSCTVVVYAVENVIITAGYIWAARYVVPHLPVRPVTFAGGIGFFLLCGLTHLEHAVHALFYRAPVHLHDHLIHAPQAVAVWVFLIYFRQDIITILDTGRRKGFTHERRRNSP